MACFYPTSVSCLASICPSHGDEDALSYDLSGLVEEYPDR